jgi:hypothetical protein
VKPTNLQVILGIALSFCICVSVFAEENLPKGLRGISFGGLYYLSYRAGQTHSFDADAGKWISQDYNAFTIKRAYLTMKKKVNPFISSRITLDAHQDDSGDMKVRIKYLYADVAFPDFAFITKPHMEVGLVHTPWMDFEEHVNYYRMQDTMFAERVGIFNSGDFGFTFLGYFGGQMNAHYQKTVNKKYSGRYGSFALGIYNGGGYHASEANQDKVFQERVTIRPLPDIVPGLQLSELFIIGKGNESGSVDDINDWRTLLGMISYEHRYLTITGQLISGYGNKSGSWSDNADYRGYSAFAEGKLTRNWQVIGRYDHFDPNVDLNDDAYNRLIAGIGYDFGHHNVLLLDYDVVTYENADRDSDSRWQTTLQIHF